MVSKSRICLQLVASEIKAYFSVTLIHFHTEGIFPYDLVDAVPRLPGIMTPGSDCVAVNLNIVSE